MNKGEIAIIGIVAAVVVAIILIAFIVTWNSGNSNGAMSSSFNSDTPSSMVRRRNPNLVRPPVVRRPVTDFVSSTNSEFSSSGSSDMFSSSKPCERKCLNNCKDDPSYTNCKNDCPVDSSGNVNQQCARNCATTFAKPCTDRCKRICSPNRCHEIEPSYNGVTTPLMTGNPHYDLDISVFLGGAFVGGNLIFLTAPDTIRLPSNTEVEVPVSSSLTFNNTTAYLLTYEGEIYESTDGSTWIISPMNNYANSKVVHISGTEDALWIQTIDDGKLVTTAGVIEDQSFTETRFYSHSDKTIYTSFNSTSTTPFKWATYDAGNTLLTLDTLNPARSIDFVNGQVYYFR